MLHEYNKKRDFNKTSEPSGQARSSKGALLFVIQKHDARRLHYDFRLEVDGVLVSWAVPKGPSLDPEDKRLAVQTEDHPLDYASFEGTIPKGQYGGGEVIVWDNGTYAPEDELPGSRVWQHGKAIEDRDAAERTMKQMIKNGKISFILNGEKLHGSWTLVKIKGKNKTKDWLLIKHKDEFVSKEDITANDKSVSTGRTLEDIRSGKAAQKQLKAAPGQPVKFPAAARKERFPRKVEPMLASNSAEAFSAEGWLFEPMLDGIRAVSYVHDGRVRLLASSGEDIGSEFSELLEALEMQDGNMILDGEIVALDSDGKPSIKLLHQRSAPKADVESNQTAKSARIIYYVFDLLHLNGTNLRNLPLSTRKELLQESLEPSQTVRFVASFAEDGNTAFHACLEQGLDGVVGKKAESKYEPGKRSKSWLKIKAAAQEKTVSRVRGKNMTNRADDTKKTKSSTKKNIVDISSKISSALAEVLAQLNNEKQSLTLEIEGNKIQLSNLNKALWPANEKEDRAAVSKRDYMIYLTRVAPFLLPHLRDRPLTLTRYPNGITGAKFYQRHWESKLPPFVEVVRYFGEQANEDKDFLLCNNISTLVWLAQIADLELHPVHTRIDPQPDALDLPREFTGSVENVEKSLLNYPDFMVLDLDPYLYSGKESKGAEPELHREGFKRAAEAAYWLKEILDEIKIHSFIKTSGRTGLHIYVPIRREIEYATVRHISELLGQQLLRNHPKEITMEWTVTKRTGKVFFDHNMNARGKSLASIYSPRIDPHATVSMPLEWTEVDKVYPTDFTMASVPELLADKGDRWADILQSKNDLAKLLQRSPQGISAKSGVNKEEH